MERVSEAGAQTPTFYTSMKDEAENSQWAKLNEFQRAADSLSESAKEAPRASKAQILNSLVKQCEMLNSILYTTGSWNALMKVYARAKSISLNEKPSLKDLKKAVSELTAALAALEQADKAKETEEEGRKEGLPLVLKHSAGEQPGGPAASLPTVSAPVVSVSAGGGVDISM